MYGAVVDRYHQVECADQCCMLFQALQWIVFIPVVDGDARLLFECTDLVVTVAILQIDRDDVWQRQQWLPVRKFGGTFAPVIVSGAAMPGDTDAYTATEGIQAIAPECHPLRVRLQVAGMAGEVLFTVAVNAGQAAAADDRVVTAGVAGIVSQWCRQDLDGRK